MRKSKCNTEELIGQNLKKALMKLTLLINTLKCIPNQLKLTEVMMLLKQETPSWSPFELTHISSTCNFETAWKRLKVCTKTRYKKLILDYQFGFPESYSTIDQMHIISSEIIKKQKVYSINAIDYAGESILQDTAQYILWTKLKNKETI